MKRPSRTPSGFVALLLYVFSVILCLEEQVLAFSIPRSIILGEYGTGRTAVRKGFRLLASVDERLSQEDDIFLSEARPRKIQRRSRLRSFLRRYSSLPRKAVRVYTDYAKLLWYETSVDARRQIAQDKASEAIRAVEQVIRGDEYVQYFSAEATEARERLLESCKEMLAEIKRSRKVVEKAESSTDIISAEHPQSQSLELPQKRRSILFGAVMGFCVACWVFSGNWIFTGLFTLMTILGQLEYYRMVMNTGVYPARKISVVGACSMFVTALFAPTLHQICLPLCGLWAMIWFLTMRRQVATIPEIATTFTGMFYLGYVPSFWVRIRLFGVKREPTRLAPIAGPVLKFLGKQAESLPSFVPQAVHLPITTGAVFIFWTWLCLAFSDVAAYFVGRTYGKTKLGRIFPAAGATSPKKSVEGLVGACFVSALLGMLGAWVQKWPFWALTGALHGSTLALLGLVGDLTASMLKRDAGIKDFGNLIPEHGGIMDRVDSFVWTAPYSWLVCVHIIPALTCFVRAR